MLKLIETLRRQITRQRLRIPIPVMAPAAPRGALAIVGIARDEADYLVEWVEFHVMMGAGRIYLYDNGSRDDTRALLARYERRDVLTRIDWPNPRSGSPQLTAYADAIIRFGAHWRWMAFIDIDEFLYPATSETLVDVLRSSFEGKAAVEVPWRNFGFCGHDAKPQGPVIGAYTERAAMDVEEGRLRKVKSIVDPCRVAAVFSAHRFALRDGQPVCVARESDALRLNHYYTRSRAEFARKLEQQAVFWGDLFHRRRDQVERRLEIARAIEQAPVQDRGILRFLPALQARLASRGGPGNA